MKNRLRLILPLLLITAAIAGLVLAVLHPRPAWQDTLDNYLAYLRTTGQHAYQLLTAVPSSSPANFTPQMSSETYSDSLVLQNSYNSTLEYSAGLQPISYPPAEVWCVLLEDGSRQQLVYVALHNSPSSADWVVHIPSDPWGSHQLQYNLQNLGCALDL
jgi:hypothetical protein